VRTAQVIKSSGSGVSEEELLKINEYTRRPFAPEELYVFSVVLCDNDVDRDFERFTVEALFQMEELFVGKTGICDHNPEAKNQRARIFECRVESVEGRKTLTGDDYFRLVAKAYMPNTQENRELIDRIESGICKEVSVGCCARSNVCSVCSKKRGEGCTHIPGRSYNGKLCYFELSHISDAYEWSFVAVPAQREAGIIKSLQSFGKDKGYMNNILKALSQGESVTLAVEDSKALARYIRRLEKRAEQGDEIREEMIGEVKRLSAVVQPEISEKTMDTVLSGLDIKQLREFKNAFEKKARVNFSPCKVQTQREPAQNLNNNNKEYSI